ncbi:leucine-rich repeat-containing protein [Pimephales promelas]|nr:leucine-rich repeat-containing protein [Pimephales promelas]
MSVSDSVHIVNTVQRFQVLHQNADSVLTGSCVSITRMCRGLTIMSAYRSVLGVAVLLLHLWETHSFPTSACPVPCLCEQGPLLNCSSLGLTTTPTRIPATAVSLNLSNNALRSLAPLSFGQVKLIGLLHLWVGSNALESLSLILKKDWSDTRTLSSGEQECTSWASDLQLLSAERNHLKRLPKGLGCMKSLQILQLSYNQISNIGLTDLDKCSNLKELHLQHNSITSIHPNAFIDLKQLQVLDLSYNLLVTIPVPAYKSLWYLNALVDVSFNRWKCDCNLQTLKRWLSFDHEMGNVSWKVVCASPPHHSGKDLLHLKDSELTCPTHEYSISGHHHNMIVYEGMQISIPCRNDSKDIMQVHWWTPWGQVTNNQKELLIEDITEQHAGLYICISGVRGEHILVFDLQVYKKHSGSRPHKLWRRIRSKRQSPPPPPTISSTEPQPYVNEGYSDVEDQEQEVRLGSRVTFGGITVEDREPYYVTVEDDHADGSSESNTEVVTLYEEIEKNKSSITGGKQKALDVEHHRGRAESSSSGSLQEGEVNALVINELPSRLTEQNVDDLDPELWNDSGESFSFTEGSERSSIRDLSSSALGHPLKDDDTWRQGKVKSPTDKIEFDSEVYDLDKPFGKEVLVDDVKQYELSDIESLSNSSDSDESVGGPNNYVVNKEFEESEIMDESDTENSANLDTLEDFTFNERMPSAGILIRQETITLEPSDIHLTFTHGDSVNEEDDAQLTTKDDNFFRTMDVSSDEVSKIKYKQTE